MKHAFTWCCKVTCTPGHPLRWFAREGVWVYCKVWEACYLIKRALQ